MASLEGAFVQVGERLNSIDRRMDGLEHRLGQVEQRMDQRFNWLTGIVVASWLSLFGTILLRH